MKFPFFQLNRPAAPPPAPPSPTPVVPPVPQRRPSPPTPATPFPTRPATSSLRTAPPPGVELPPNLQFRLRSLLPLLPDEALAFPRTEIPQHLLDQTVLLPTDLIIPQLAGARVTIPIVTLLDAVPPEILQPSRSISTTMNVTLPLQEIVAQLPPRFFTARLSQRVVTEIAADIPNPFQERKPVPPPPPTPVEPQPPVRVEALVPSPTPSPITETPVTAPPPPPVAEPQPIPVAVAPAPVEVAASAVPVARTTEPPTPVPVETVATVVEPAPVEPVPAEAPPEDEKKFLINLNRCSVEDLLVIKGVGPALARRIIAWRTEHGRFNSLDELRQVPGVGRKTFRALVGAKPQALNRLLGAPEHRELTLQEIVHYTSRLPGLQGCMLATSDGLLLTGDVPPHLDKEAISVFAPQLFRRVARYTKELKVGQVQRFTLFTDQQPVSIFSAEEVFLVVFHDTKHFSKRLLRLCERISAEIARLCRQRTTV